MDPQSLTREIELLRRHVDLLATALAATSVSGAIRADDIAEQIDRMRGVRPDAIVPFRAAHAPTPEPEATLRYGDVEIVLTLTYVHHLNNYRGWGNALSSFSAADHAMREAMQRVESLMWAAVGAQYP